MVVYEVNGGRCAMESPKKKRLGAGRVAFLARVGAIKEMIDEGHTMAAVYEKYSSQLEISYSQFVNYVNKFIRKKQEPRKTESPEPRARTATTNIKSPAATKIEESSTTENEGGRDFTNDAEERAKRDEDLF
jgi:hypothetical protein